MSPASVVMLEHLTMALVAGPVLGIAVNAAMARFFPHDSPVRRFLVAFLASTPSQMQAVAAALVPGLSVAEREIRHLNMLDAALSSLNVAMQAAKAPAPATAQLVMFPGSDEVTQPDVKVKA